jgi:adenylate cyclase class 2
MASSGREVEIKLAARSVEDAKRRLRAAGFRVCKRRVFEQNTVFDTASFELRQSACLLRVREAGRTYTLTYKGVPTAGKHKDREEIETSVEDGRTFATILARLGYLPSFRYEKFRTEYKSKGSRGVATLDETPVGIYLELEGDPQWIDRMAHALGYEEKDYIVASYGRLFFDWRERTGSQAADMTFPAARRLTRARG